MVQFSGGKYDPLTLQDIKTNANDTSTTKTCFSLGDASATENGVLRSINSTANGNVRVLRKFDCGPTCAKRLLAYHKLKHYPYTLLQRCRQKMNSIGNGPESVDKLFDDKMWINNQKREFQSSIEAAEALGLS
ncbi:hypothetical protein SARC_10098 [Sphaeroforma arctica JP610]|uniref:Uncharacterized protein n=1 Tax=Sphaeroforma arctica JP610 TaxID=667725 RepID=A0A0L0FN29_9EUKA|nr:hypothetical protein SARC_10098 [Sphaeroforma arctica JP610]KNC77438.1 hypothetical protein SARC_10098 [Sphaeroforma arctica JP610]|eukprot:XP_014151340.1 hypothetical protein SARC_10098 [Sphaeroforma arctica JP610]